MSYKKKEDAVKAGSNTNLKKTCINGLLLFNVSSRDVATERCYAYKQVFISLPKSAANVRNNKL